MKAQATERYYYVCWRSTLTGATGKSAPLSEEIAKAKIKTSNKDCPELHHWIEPVEKEKKP